MSVLLLAAVGAGYAFSGMVDQVRIGSERYDRIIALTELQSEVSLPSLHVVQAQLAVQALVLSDDEPKPNDLAALSRLERGYERSYEAWVAQLAEFADPELERALDASHVAAGAYFEALDSSFLSAARTGDREGMQEAVTGALAQQYALQQATAEEVAVTAGEQLASVERAAAADLVSDRRQMMGAGVVLGLLAVALTLVTLRATSARLRRMRHLAHKEFPRLVAQAEVAAETGGKVVSAPLPAVRGNDQAARTERALHQVVETAVDLAGETARLRHTTSDLFAYTGRRNHQLLSQSLARVSALEDRILDAGRNAALAGLRDDLIRMRRHAESMLVIAGAAAMRQWDGTVPPSQSLHAALAEIESAERVSWDLDDSVAIVGPAGADLAQLLAELLDNATRSSPPDTAVSVHGSREGDDYVFAISDAGLGMAVAELSAANELLANSELDLRDSRRLGLSVVARLADRHGFAVTLATGPMGGMLARVRVPGACLRQVEDAPAAAESPATLSLAGPPPATESPAPEVALLSVPVGVESLTLPRRIRGASLDAVLHEVPAALGPAEGRSPEAVRDSLTALAAGRAAAADRHPDQRD